jgi:hypothetical protein
MSQLSSTLGSSAGATAQGPPTFSQLLPQTETNPPIPPPGQAPISTPISPDNAAPLFSPNSQSTPSDVAHVYPATAMTPVPAKRKPGRPKGSGKKHGVDTNAAPPIKRPVGRPRKDGLPSGSGPSRRETRARKAPPGQFASAGPGPVITPVPGNNWGGNRVDLGIVSQSAAPNFAQSISAGPSRVPAVQAQPQVAVSDIDWYTKLKTHPTGFIAELVAALGPVASSHQDSAQKAFGSHLAALNITGAAMPYLYNTLRTFWVPHSPAYFELIIPGGPGRPPQSPDRFFYWDPLPLALAGLPCPTCGTPLAHKGRIRHGVLTVHDLRSPFYIIGAEYACENKPCLEACPPRGRLFSSVDASILQALPAGLRKEFPARLLGEDQNIGTSESVWNWAVYGVSNGLFDLVHGALRTGAPRAAVMDIVRSTQHGVSDMTQPMAFVPKTETSETAALSQTQATTASAMEVEQALQASASTLLS